MGQEARQPIKQAYVEAVIAVARPVLGKPNPDVICKPEAIVCRLVAHRCRPWLVAVIS
jgi:hypothetical protein